MTAVVGRDDALAQVERFLAEARNRYLALVLEGEPGIGKTTVWREGVRLGEEAGFRILACRPAQAEARLAFAALVDLLGAVKEDILAELPEPQRNAQRVMSSGVRTSCRPGPTSQETEPVPPGAPVVVRPRASPRPPEQRFSGVAIIGRSESLVRGVLS